MARSRVPGFAFFSLALSLFLAAWGCVPGSRVRVQPVLPPIHDTAIVPSRRVGPVSIGMTEAQVFDAMGSPQSSTPSIASTKGTSNTVYRYGTADRGLQVWVDPKSSLVSTIWVEDPTYSLPSGVHIGSTSLEAKAKLGTPAWAHEVNPFNYSYCYDDGTLVELLTQQPHIFDRVSAIAVCGCLPHGHSPAPGCV